MHIVCFRYQLLSGDTAGLAPCNQGELSSLCYPVLLPRACNNRLSASLHGKCSTLPLQKRVGKTPKAMVLEPWLIWSLEMSGTGHDAEWLWCTKEQLALPDRLLIGDEFIKARSSAYRTLEEINPENTRTWKPLWEFTDATVWWCWFFYLRRLKTPKLLFLPLSQTLLLLMISLLTSSCFLCQHSNKHHFLNPLQPLTHLIKDSSVGSASPLVMALLFGTKFDKVHISVSKWANNLHS